MIKQIPIFFRLILLHIFLVTGQSYAQSPGNVSGSLDLWLKADAGTASIGTSWQDQSGNGNDYITVSGPTVQTGVHNFNPAVEILSGGFNAPAGAALTTNNTIFFVAQKLASDNNGRIFDGSTGNYIWGYASTFEFSVYIEGNPHAWNANDHPLPINSGGLDLRLQSYVHNGTTSIEARADGKSLFTFNNVNSAAGVGIDINQGSISYQSSDSRVGELILYNTTLSTPEVQRVESYLALKYGITLDQSTGGQDYSASDDGTTKMWDASNAGNYDHDIFGIGRDDNSALIQRQSKSVNSDAMVTVGLGQIAADNTSNGNNFGVDLNFMTIANDNGDIALESYDITNGGITYNTRLSRQWMVQEPNGDVGTVDLQFDINNAFFRNKTLSDMVLLVDADGDFNTGSLAISASSITGTPGRSGATVLFDNLTQLNDQTFFTLAVRHSRPGNVSDNIGLWLKANQGVYTDLNPSDGNLAGSTLATDGQSSQSWDDVSGARTHDATTTANFPVFRDNVTDNINFNPALDFDGVNDRFFFGNDYIFSSGTGTEDGMTWFAVVKPDANTSGSTFVFDFGLFPNKGYGLSYNSNTYGFYASRDYGGASVGGNHNLDTRSALMRFSIDFGTDLSFTLDGAVTPNTTRDITLTALTASQIDERGSPNDNGSPFSIGRQGKNHNLTSRLFDGRIAEIIGYNRDLSSTESNRVESYLAIKYGITIDQTTAQDYVASDGTTEIWNKDATHAERFNHDIAGIFRDDLSGLDQRVARSVNTDAILTIALDNNFTASNADATRTTAFASDLSGLSWGNNNGDVTNFVSADFPVVGNNRWARVWYAQNVNFNSTVNIQFTDSNIEDGVTYYLISETDGDGNFAISDDGVVENGGVGVVATGNTVSFAGVNLNNKFFTLALKIEANYMRHGKFFRKGSEQRMKFGKKR